MKLSTASLLFFSFLLICFSGGLRQVSAQEVESILNRILNPLPEYDPFDKPPPLPKYFPDEVDKRVRQSLIDSLAGKADALQDDVRFFINKDGELKKERGQVTGITEHVLDLFNNTIQDREGYLAAQKKALASASPRQKQLIESRLRNDDLTRAESLIRESATNRWGGMFNRLLSSVDLVSILSGSYVGAAVDATMSQLLSLGSAEMPIEERKALTFYLEHLKRYPNDPKNEDIRKNVEALENKKKGALVRKQIEKALESAQKGDLGQAKFYYEIASFIDPSSREAQEGMENVKKRLRQQQDERRETLSVAPNLTVKFTDSPEDQAASKLLYALALGDPGQIDANAKTVEEKFRGKPFADSARDAAAVALEMIGHHEEAKKILQQVARSSQDPKEKRRAETLLGSPEYDLLASFEEARSQHRRETVKYVLFGEDFLKKNLLYATAPLLTSGPAGAASVAAADMIMIGTKLYQVLTANPISNQPVIDKGVAYIRSHPHSENAGEVYTILADAYEQAGIYDKAIAYYEMSGKNVDKKISELKENIAKTLLQRAEKSQDRSDQQAYLKAILDDYPESAAAKEATHKLAELSKIKNQGLQVSKKFLMEHPELYGPHGLRLKATLFDGNLSNMELADQGVNLLSEREILLHLQTPWGIRSQTYSIDNEAARRFQMALREKNYELAINDVNSRPKESTGGIKNLPLALVKREPDKKGVESGDAALKLVQEAANPSPASPTVLNQQLLSESEKEGGSKFRLPPIQGSISANRFDLSGSLPAGIWGDRIAVGTDGKSPFAGLQFPVPLLQGFIPVDFMLQGRPGRFSVFPKIHLYKDNGDDQELYR